MKRVIAGKAESTPGTKETLADTDFNVKLDGSEGAYDLQFDDTSSRYHTGGYNSGPVVHGIQGSGMKTNCMVHDGNAIDSAPKQGKFMEACGYKETIYTSAGVSYQDSPDADLQTITLNNIAVSQGSTDGIIVDEYAGCMGNMVISAESIGKPVKIAYDFKGKLSGVSDQTRASLLELTSPDTSIVKPFQGGNSVTIGSFASCIQSFSLDCGNVIAPTLCKSDDTGIKYFSKMSSDPILTMVILLDTVSNYDYLTKVIAETKEPGLITWGNWSIIAPQMQILTPVRQDANGLEALQLSFKLLRNGGTNSDLENESSHMILQGATS